MRVAELVRRTSVLGDSAQASVPGLYAWAVTVVPPAWARGAPAVAKVAAVAALMTLGLGIASERRWGGRARIAAFWGFIGACAVSWIAARPGSGSARFDAQAGVAGMLGWALFAFVSAAPPLATDASTAADLVSAPSSGGRLARHPGGDLAYLAFGALAAAAINVWGWRVPGEERALLVRCIALAAGLAVIGASAHIALARYAPRAVVAASRRMRRAALALVVLAVLAFVGLLLQIPD